MPKLMPVLYLQNGVTLGGHQFCGQNVMRHNHLEWGHEDLQPIVS